MWMLARVVLYCAVAVSLAPLAARAVCGDFGLPDGTQIVEFDTTEGSICIEMLDDEDDAPMTVANFLFYLNRGDYQRSLQHRVTTLVPDGLAVIQGGAFRLNDDDAISLIDTAPAMSPWTSIPTSAEDRSPTGESTLKRPPTPSGTTNER